MIRQVIRFDCSNKDDIIKCAEDVMKDDPTLSFEFISRNTVHFKCTGFLHSEVVCGRVRDAFGESLVFCDSPEVLFQQSVVNISVQTPMRFKTYVMNHLLYRRPIRAMSVIQLDLNNVLFRGTFPLHTTHGLIERLRASGSKDIMTTIEGPEMQDVTKTDLIDQLRCRS